MRLVNIAPTTNDTTKKLFYTGSIIHKTAAKK